MNLLKNIKHWAYPTASKYFSRATLAEGTLKNTGTPFRCLFVDNSLFTIHLARKMYEEPVHTVRKWRIWLPALKKLVHQLPDTDLCIAILPQCYEANIKGSYTFKSREWVRQVLDISAPWGEVRKRFHSRKRQLTNTLGKKYGYRISTDQEDFDFFYHQMYLPHTQKQFGIFSHISSHEYLKGIFSKGFLLLVTEEGRTVSGSICLIEDNALIFRDMGVFRSREAPLKRDSQSALYFFMIVFAKKQGLHEVNFMKSRSFFSDGVYRTKREWGSAVYPDNEAESWVYYFIPRYTEGVVSFFENNPAIVHTENGLKGVVGISGPPGSFSETEKKLLKQFYAPGLDGLLLLSPRRSKIIELAFDNFRPHS